MKNSEKYIGVFDSGMGGLTVVKSLLEKYPYENVVYLGDTKHMPYGDKSNEQIIKCVMDDVKFLNTYELKTIIIACNTADAIASDILRKSYNVPIYGVVSAAAKKASKITTNNRIGVIATTAAINSNQYPIEIGKNNVRAKVYSQACPFLVPLIEEGKFDIGNQEIRFILEDYLSPLIENDIDTLILGCTHYDLLSEIIKDMYPNLKIVSSSRCVIDDIENKIEFNKDKNCEQLYYVSSDKKRFNDVASMFMPNIEVHEI